MKSELKQIILNLNPALFNVKKIIISSFKKLGVGEGNINYVFKVNNKKFICRLNIESEKSDKVEREFKTLKKIEKYNFSPKPVYFNKNPEFSILKFIEGKPFRQGKRTYTSVQIKNIAKTLAKLHSIKTSIKPVNYDFEYYTHGAKHLITDLNKRTKNKFKKELKQIFNVVLSSVPKNEIHKYSLIHGDVCPQNIVETAKDVRFIDWENVEVSDPARDIAQVIIDLGLQKNYLVLFQKTYFSIRKDDSLFVRARSYAILMMQNYYIWECIRALEVKNKELPKEYLQKTSVREHLIAAQKNLVDLNKLIPIPLFEVDMVC